MIGLIMQGGPLKRLLASSIGKKLFVGVTGLLLVGFLVTHLAANLTIFGGEHGFLNEYTASLERNPLIIPMELGLAGLFVLHAAMAIWVTKANRSARGSAGYDGERTKGGRTFASITMPYTGLIVLAFLVMHMVNFRFATAPMTEVAGHEGRNIWLLVMNFFQSPVNVIVYVAAMGVVGLHVSHGLQSMFRTLGLVHPKYTPAVEKVSIAVGVIFATGFSAIPIWAIGRGVSA